MYKKRVLPKEIFSYRVLGKTKEGEWTDSFSLGPFNYYAFTDAVEAIVRHRKVTNTNAELEASTVLIENDQTRRALKNLIISDLEPYWEKYSASSKYEQMVLRVQYWKKFDWQKRESPDIEKVLISASFKDGKWVYSQAP